MSHENNVILCKPNTEKQAPPLFLMRIKVGLSVTTPYAHVGRPRTLTKNVKLSMTRSFLLATHELKTFHTDSDSIMSSWINHLGISTMGMQAVLKEQHHPTCPGWSLLWSWVRVTQVDFLRFKCICVYFGFSSFLLLFQNHWWIGRK